MIVKESLYIGTGNDIIGDFRSATHRANATANLSVKKYFFSIIEENANASNLKFTRHVRLTGGLIVSELVGFSCRNK